MFVKSNASLFSQFTGLSIRNAIIPNLGTVVEKIPLMCTFTNVFAGLREEGCRQVVSDGHLGVRRGEGR